MMSTTRRPFFKGLPSFVVQNDTLEASEARKSIYYWWWAFARLSPVLWYAQRSGVKPIEASIAKVSECLGDVWRYPSFTVWWKLTGSKVFAESKRPAKVQALDLNALHEHSFDPNKLYLEVPLNIRQQTIISQFKKLLASKHDGRGLNLAAHSTATLKLHTKRYRLPTIEHEYWVLLYRLLYPNIAMWRIGDRLKVAPQHKVRDGDGSILNKSKVPLNAVTGRYYYKARFTLLNMERDSFPNYSTIEVSSRKQPFGTEHQKDFRACTEDGQNGELSAWTQFLQSTYLSDLKYEIIERNYLRDSMKMPDSKVRQRIVAFIAGESDLLT